MLRFGKRADFAWCRATIANASVDGGASLGTFEDQERFVKPLWRLTEKSAVQVYGAQKSRVTVRDPSGNISAKGVSEDADPRGIQVTGETLIAAEFVQGKRGVSSPRLNQLLSFGGIGQLFLRAFDGSAIWEDDRS